MRHLCAIYCYKRKRENTSITEVVHVYKCTIVSRCQQINVDGVDRSVPSCSSVVHQI